MIYATIHEYEALSPKLACVTASVTAGATQDALYDALSREMSGKAKPVRASFRWLDDSRTSVIGYVYASAQVEYLPKGVPPKGYRQIAANIYMDETDKSMWDMKDGVGGKFLAKQGQEDLRAMLETARTSPRGSQPRMASIVRSFTMRPSEFVAFVSEGHRTAEMDYGVVLGKNDNGSLRVLSNLTQQDVTVEQTHVVSAHQLEHASLPKIPASKIVDFRQRQQASRTVSQRVNAGDENSRVLTPQEYWPLAFRHSPEYVAKILKQVEEMAAL